MIKMVSWLRFVHRLYVVRLSLVVESLAASSSFWTGGQTDGRTDYLSSTEFVTSRVTHGGILTVKWED